MVKNTHGGNKSKSMARKNNDGSATYNSAPLRLPSCEFEKIAVVDKLLGNGMFYATTNDGLKLLCHIRNKFKGRSRRANDVNLGKFVLIGLRDWEKPNFKQSDLLLVYDESHIPIISFNNYNYHNHNNLIFYMGDGGDESPPLAPLEASSEKANEFLSTEDFIDDI
jgi:translation initiation factor IF-1